MFWERSDSTLSDEMLRTRSHTIAPHHAFEALASLYPNESFVILKAPINGTFNVVWPMTNVSSDPDLVVRFNVHPNVSTQSLHLESWAANEALARGFPTPRIVSVDTSRQHSLYSFQVIEYVDGVPLRATSEETVRKVLGQLGTALARLHAGPPPSGRYGRVGLGTLPDWDWFLTCTLDDHLAYCRERDIITKDQRQDIERAFQSIISLESPALLHGDLSYDNIILDGSTQDLKSVIDWEDAVLGDPIFELAGLATFHPVERHASFLDAYYGGTQRPDQFESSFWIYYLRIALAKAVHRHRFGYVTEVKLGHQNPDERIALAIAHLKDLS